MHIEGEMPKKRETRAWKRTTDKEFGLIGRGLDRVTKERGSIIQ